MVVTAAQATPEGATEMTWKDKSAPYTVCDFCYCIPPILLLQRTSNVQYSSNQAYQLTEIAYLQNCYSYLEPRTSRNFISAILMKEKNLSAFVHFSQSWVNNDIKLRWINWNPTGSMLETSSHTVKKHTTL